MIVNIITVVSTVMALAIDLFVLSVVMSTEILNRRTNVSIMINIEPSIEKIQ